MDPVSWIETAAEGSPVVLLLVVMLALFMDSLAVIGALLPGDLLLLVPAAAVGLPNALTIVPGGVLGTVLGYTVSHNLGRRSGTAIRNSRVGRWVGEHRWVQAEHILRGPAGRTLALIQFLPVLNFLVPLLAGTLQMPLKRFLKFTSIGSAAYCGSFVMLGVLAGDTGAAIGDSTGRLLGLLIVTGLVAALGCTVLAGTARRMTDKDKRQRKADEDKRKAGKDKQRTCHDQESGQDPLTVSPVPR